MAKDKITQEDPVDLLDPIPEFTPIAEREADVLLIETMRVDCVTFHTDPTDGHVTSASVGLVGQNGSVANFDTLKYEQFQLGSFVEVRVKLT